jgi:hypothetical protein
MLLPCALPLIFAHVRNGTPIAKSSSIGSIATPFTLPLDELTESQPAAMSDCPPWKGVPMKVYVPHTLRVRVPNASYVSVVGDFNNWHSNAHPLVQTGADSWGRLVDIPVGTHRYAFFVVENGADGALRSRIVEEGVIRCASEQLEKSFQVAAYPELALNCAEREEELMVA